MRKLQIPLTFVWYEEWSSLNKVSWQQCVIPFYISEVRGKWEIEQVIKFWELRCINLWVHFLLCVWPLDVFIQNRKFGRFQKIVSVFFSFSFLRVLFSAIKKKKDNSLISTVDVFQASFSRISLTKCVNNSTIGDCGNICNSYIYTTIFYFGYRTRFSFVSSKQEEKM